VTAGGQINVPADMEFIDVETAKLAYNMVQ
jgi:hypothetical protein